MIKRGSCQASYEDSRCEYEPVSYLWPYIDPNSDSSFDGSIDEGIKDQENFDDQGKEVVSSQCTNPIRLRQGDQRSLRQLKSEL